MPCDPPLPDARQAAQLGEDQQTLDHAKYRVLEPLDLLGSVDQQENALDMTIAPTGNHNV